MDLAVGAVGEVPAVEPAAGQGDRGGRLGLAVVAGRHRGAAEHEPAHRPLGERSAGVVDDAGLVLRQLAPRRDELEGRGVARGRGLRPSVRLEGPARDAVHLRAAAHGREREPDRALGEAVDRHHGLRPEAAGRETSGEALHRARADRLGAVQGCTPGGEIESLERLVRDAPRAQLVGEIRRCRQRRPPLVDGPQPPFGARKERGGGQERQRQAVVEAGQPGADEPHVVVEGQPADSDVGGAHLEAGGDRADVGEQVVVGEQDALGLAGAARGVLDEGRVVALALRAGHRCARGRELVGGHHVGERLHRGPQEADHGPRARDRHEQAHPGVGQDGGLPGGVLPEPVEADGG